MHFTLFGYPQTGKTTLFNALTGARAGAPVHEGAVRGAHERIAPIPDPRLDRLSALTPEKKRVPASVDFVDLAGISLGEVKTSVFLNALRLADILVHVVRSFRNDDIPHAKPVLDPASDMRSMEEELVLADLLAVEQRLERLDKDLKKMKSPDLEREHELLGRLRAHLETGAALRGFPFHESEDKLVRSFAFLSRKPLLHVINAGEEDIPRLAALERPATADAPLTAVWAACARLEAEILEIEDPADKDVFRKEYGLAAPAADRFFAAAFELMRLVFFYTIGKDEVRSWPLPRGAHALQAAGSIHTDIEKGFIRAEVIPVVEVLRHGSWAQAKDKGALRLEGRDYPVHDGDVIFFRFAT